MGEIRTPVELVEAAVCRLIKIPQHRFQEAVKQEIDGAGGLLTPEAAAYLAADKFGVRVTYNQALFDKKAWVYNFIAIKEAIDSDSKRTAK